MSDADRSPERPALTKGVLVAWLFGVVGVILGGYGDSTGNAIVRAVGIAVFLVAFVVFGSFVIRRSKEEKSSTPDRRPALSKGGYVAWLIAMAGVVVGIYAERTDGDTLQTVSAVLFGVGFVAFAFFVMRSASTRLGRGRS